MTGHLSILRNHSRWNPPMTSETDLRTRLAEGSLSVVATHACRAEDLRPDERAPGNLYVMHETGRCWIDSAEPSASYDLLTLCGYEGIRDAYAAQLGAAPIQIRSTVPFVLAGILCQFVPLSPAQIVERIAAGTPFLMERHQIVSAIVACLRHAGGINSRCTDGSMPELPRTRLGDVMTLRLAAERATDRGLLLSRIDNAILSALISLSQDGGEASVATIAEWIGARIDEQHSNHAILGALGTLGWRGFTILRSDGETGAYRITASGCAALLSEIGKMAALHRDVVARAEEFETNRAA